MSQTKVPTREVTPGMQAVVDARMDELKRAIDALDHRLLPGGIQQEYMERVKFQYDRVLRAINKMKGVK